MKLTFFLICILISVAFLTLLERKILSFSQIRKGPNKMGFKGVLQPVSDAVKLFTKEITYLFLSNWNMYLFSPAFALCLALTICLCFPFQLFMLELSLSLIFILCIFSVSVYPVIGAGYTSNSKFSLLGSLRTIAQTISYEVSFAFILMSMVVFLNSYNLQSWVMYKQCLVVVSVPLFIAYFISILAETSRTPFDFSEGESELVSGFNTEFSAGMFALFFLAEYSSILFMSGLTALLFFSGASFLVIKLSFFTFLFIWIRSTLPRLRYDKLMDLAWKKILPFSLIYLSSVLSLSLVWKYF